MENYFHQNGINLQTVPPDEELHRRNQSERATQTAKAHIISGFATCDPDFPADQAHELSTAAEATLNILRSSGIPGISAWEALRGPFDSNSYRLHPIGCRIALYDPDHLSWGNRALEGFYLGFSPGHYRSHRCYVIATRGVRDSVSLGWLPRTTSSAIHYDPLPQHLFTGEPAPVLTDADDVPDFAAAPPRNSTAP